jgi:hypothetical protein
MAPCERRLNDEYSRFLKTCGIPPCDTSLKIERAGALPGKARRLPAAETFGSQRRPDGETSDAREQASTCELKGKICRFGTKTLTARLTFRIHPPSY